MRPCQPPAQCAPSRLDDLPDPLPPLVLLVGDEELLVARSVSAVAAALRRARPRCRSRPSAPASEIDGPELHELLGPSLFGDTRLVVLRAAQDLRVAAVAVLTPYLETPAEGTTLVAAARRRREGQGGARGGPQARRARDPVRQGDPCRRARRFRAGRGAPGRRADRAGRRRRAASTRSAATCANWPPPPPSWSATPAATSTSTWCAHYHQGRAEVSGFAIADLAVVGNAPAALEALRYALDLGVPHVVIADAMADGVRTIARVASAGRGERVPAGAAAGHAAVEGQARPGAEPRLERAGRAPCACRRSPCSTPM